MRDDRRSSGHGAGGRVPSREPWRPGPPGAGVGAGGAGGRREVVIVPPGQGGRLDAFLAAALALPPARVRSLAEGGRIRIRGKACAPLRRLHGGEEIEVTLPAPRGLAGAGEGGEDPGPALELLWGDDDALVVAKPPGLPVEPAGPRSASVLGSAARLGPFDVDGRAAPGLPHRLDRDTSGALLLARSDRALAALRAAFEAGAVEKTYLAIVGGEPPERGRLDTPYARDPADPRRFTTRVPSPRRARLAFTVVRRLAGAALLEVSLETGRTHQIRVQLSEAGWPVLGDAVYGAPSPHLERQALHASRLVFPRPSDGARVEVSAPLPADLARALEALAPVAPRPG